MAEAEILGAIVARKRSDVAARLGGVSLADLRGRASPARRSLAAALARPGARFILEIKKESPSQGALRHGADPAAMARAYALSASAISVLTDAPFFGGSLDDLAAVRRAWDGPILAKDFIVDPRQVAEARLHGADAVLAILAVLDDEAVRAVMAEAAALGMEVLVEAHDAAEVKRAVALGAQLVGINNRDLRTLEVDLAVTERLSPLVPRDRLVVAESGIADRADVARLAPHADAFLVGSALMRAPCPAEAARALAFGRVKICGLTEAADVATAAAAGASFAGMVLVPGTPRAVDVTEAESVAAAARAAGIEPVGIFRNGKLMEVARAAHVLRLAAVQLHGEEDLSYIAALRNLLDDGVEIWAAEGVGSAPSGTRGGADRALFDSQVGGRSGGTGIAFDWSLVAGRDELCAGLLAGGINPGNARAASQVGAWALDVGSGVESVKRRKDPSKIAALFEALRQAARGEASPCA